MEREIQVISPGALGNAMQPGQCPPPPAAAFVQNGKLLGGGCGNGHRPAPGMPAAPSIAQRWKVLESIPGCGAHGVPQLREQREPSCPRLGSGSVGAVWLPSPSPSGKYLSGVYGDRAGSGTPSPGAGPGSPINSVTLEQHRQRPVAAAPFADANLGILAGAV